MAAGKGFRQRSAAKRPDRLDVETLNTTRAMIQRIDLPKEARLRIGVPHEMAVSDIVAALREMALYLRRAETEGAA